MRFKEEAKDYRYFPEPDLTPFILSKQKIEEIRQSVPELPRQKLERFIREYEGISENDAAILVLSRKNSDYAEACLKIYAKKNKKPVVNWLIGPLAAIASESNLSFPELKVPQENLVELVNFVDSQQISGLAAKSVLADMVASGKHPSEIIKEKNLIQISDTGLLEDIAQEVVRENPGPVGDYRAGKANALMFMVGQVMKKSKGKANPKIVQQILKDALGKLSDCMQI